MADVPWESEEGRNYSCLHTTVINVVSIGLRKTSETLATRLASVLGHGMTPVQVVASCFIVKNLGQDRTRMHTSQNF